MSRITPSPPSGLQGHALVSLAQFPIILTFILIQIGSLYIPKVRGQTNFLRRCNDKDIVDHRIRAGHEYCWHACDHADENVVVSTCEGNGKCQCKPKQCTDDPMDMTVPTFDQTFCPGSFHTTPLDPNYAMKLMLCQSQCAAECKAGVGIICGEQTTIPDTAGGMEQRAQICTCACAADTCPMTTMAPPPMSIPLPLMPLPLPFPQVPDQILYIPLSLAALLKSGLLKKALLSLLVKAFLLHLCILVLTQLLIGPLIKFISGLFKRKEVGQIMDWMMSYMESRFNNYNSGGGPWEGSQPPAPPPVIASAHDSYTSSQQSYLPPDSGLTAHQTAAVPSPLIHGERQVISPTTP